MSITRRTLLLGAGTGAVAVLLAACTPEPKPRPTRTIPAPKPTAPSEVPEAAAFARSRWASDPYSFGSTSYVPAGADPAQRAALAEPVMDRLFFAGEATDTERPGTVLGAVDSGEKVAERVLDVAEDEERIAVVGAGAAGVVAARLLADAGHQVTVFEARDRTGGRIHSREDEQWPIPLQAGAWLLGQEDVAEIERRGIALGGEQLTFETAVAWSDEGEAAPLDNGPLTRAIEKAAGQPTDLPLVEALQQDGLDPDDPTLAAALAWVSATTGADPERASSWYPPAILPDALQGYASDLSRFIDEHLGDLEVTLASPVARAAYDEKGVSLRLATGEALSFDRVVLTVPLGVLQRQQIEFAPALPFAHRTAVGALAPGFIETIWMRFDEAFWDTEAKIIHVVGGDGPVRTWLNLQKLTLEEEPVLIGIVGGADAEQFAALSDEDAQTAARASLAPLVPDASEE